MADLTPVRVLIAPGADLTAHPSGWVFTDVTSRVRQSAPVSIDYGRSDEWETVDPATCKIVFDDAAGDFSELNPNGQWYGTLGQDTPVKVLYRAVDTTTTQTVASAGGSTYTSLGRTLRNVEVNLRFTAPVTISGGGVTVVAQLRRVDGSNFLGAIVTIAVGGAVSLSIGQVVGGVFTSLASLASVPGASFASGDTLNLRATAYDGFVSAAAWEGTGTPPADQITAAVPIVVAGDVGIQATRTAGNTNSGLTWSYSIARADVVRFGGYASNWAPATSHRDADQTVAITATGELGRLSPRQATLPKLSPYSRAFLANTNRLAYWPMEDGSQAGQVASALPGHSPLSVTGTITFDKVDAFTQFVSYLPPVTSAVYRYGTPSLANLEAGASLDAPVPSSVTTGTVAEQSIHILARFDQTQTSGDLTLLEWDTPGGTWVKWRLILVKSPVNMIVRGIKADGSTNDLINAGGATVGLVSWVVALRQNGGNVTAGLLSNGSMTGYQYTGSSAGTLAGITRVAVNTSATTYADDLFPAGQLLIRGEFDPALIENTTDAYGSPVGSPKIAYTNEPAQVRLARLATEDGLRMTTTLAPDAESVERMFSQATETAPELYRAAEAVDGGVLHEAPFGLAYRSRYSLYHQPVGLTLGYTSDLAEPPMPDLSVGTLRTQITVDRTEGSSVTVRTPDVAAGRVLPRVESIELELFADSQIEQQAYWRLNRRALRVPRWPGLTLNLGARPALVDAWLSAGIGTRTQITGLRSRAGGGTVEAVLEGWTERLGTVTATWTAELNLSPGDILAQVGIYDSTESRYDSATSTLTSSLTSSATSFSVTTTNPDDLWVTGTGLGLRLKLGGEEITVGTITGTTSPQTFSVVTRSVNGVTKAHAAGTRVSLATPARYAL